MGQRGRGRGRGKGNGGSNKPRTDSNRNASGGNYQVVNQTNETFESYYTKQGIIPADEWDQFLAALKAPLPTTFRLTASRPTALALHEHIKQVYVPFLSGLEYEGKPLSPPKPLDWYPQSLAWQLDVPKQALRKDDKMKKFQHFLVYETDAGNVSRQEAVSMIPPLLLDVQPGHTALDMCAAPGSKSVQILEALHGPSTASPNLVPQGLLIANDSDAKRCHLLVHQSLHRVPGTGMMVTNHDATQLPSLRLPKSDETIKERLAFTTEDEAKLQRRNKDKVAQEYEPMLFDRILADVPCSGDGTLRKNLGIWKDWTVGNGIGLHALQLRILERGIALLKPGGRLVYSTCSMNPMENESVVSAALSLHPEMSILPVPDDLPGLIRRPGLTTWQVLDNALNPAPHPDTPVSELPEDAPVQPTEEDVKAVEQDNNKGRTLTDKEKQEQKDAKKAAKGKGKGNGPNNVDKKGQRKAWTKTLWPHGDEKEKGLEHCLRLYPHLQDTGAFFVCVLVKKGDAAPAPVEVEAEEKMVEEPKEVEMKEDAAPAAVEKRERASSPVDGQPEAKKLKPATEESAPAGEAKPVEAAPAAAEEKKETMGAGRPFNEEPYIYVKGHENEEVQIIRDFFGVSDSFPFADLLVRNASGLPMRSIYLTSDLTRSLLLSNAYTRMRLISCGVRLFTRQDNTKDGTYRCKWRINSEGLEVIRPYLSDKRVVTAGNEVLRQVMENVSVRFEDIKEEETKKQMMAMEPGSAILRIPNAKGNDIEMEEDLCLAFWLSKVSCNLMVEKVEKSALSLRLFGEDCTPHANGKKVSPIVGPGKEKSAAAAGTISSASAGDSSAAPSDAEAAAAVKAVEAEEKETVEAETEVEKVEEGAGAGDA
ncbi:hypothetical protein JCM8097_008941 [Rhodosporidiobolus ruineniae]